MPDEISIETEGDTRAKFRVFIRGTAQAVWDEITRTDQPIRAFFGARMDAPSLTPGSRLRCARPMAATQVSSARF
ncbi:MAG: hypothetical protein AAF937_02520 [Planctomycetota bacterium]